MARTAEDLVQYQLLLTATISLDWERIEQDPVFRTIVMTYESSDECSNEEVIRKASLDEYLHYYIVRERFLRDMPATNGPGTLHLEAME